MKSLVYLLSGLLLVSFASATVVQFNGVWSEGTTLYSDTYNVDGAIYGRDAYPLRSGYQPRTCTKIYETVTEKKCRWVHRQRVCTLTERQKLVRTLCTKPTLEIGCMNPDGKYTNQLNLMNFEYSLDGGAWQTVPYEKTEVNGAVNFRLNIPSDCKPTYNYNEVISIA